MSGRGYLGVILMRTLGLGYEETMEVLDDIEAYILKHGYSIEVEKHLGFDEID